MKQFILGALAAYAVLLTCYTSGLHHGKIASSQQACVTTAAAMAQAHAEKDYVTLLQEARQ